MYNPRYQATSQCTFNTIVLVKHIKNRMITDYQKYLNSHCKHKKNLCREKTVKTVNG